MCKICMFVHFYVLPLCFGGIRNFFLTLASWQCLTIFFTETVVGSCFRLCECTSNATLLQD